MNSGGAIAGQPLVSNANKRRRGNETNSKLADLPNMVGRTTRSMCKNNNSSVNYRDLHSIGLSNLIAKKVGSRSNKIASNAVVEMPPFIHQDGDNLCNHIISEQPENAEGDEDAGREDVVVEADLVRTTVNAQENSEFPENDSESEGEGLDESFDPNENDWLRIIDTVDNASIDGEVTFKVNTLTVSDEGDRAGTSGGSSEETTGAVTQQGNFDIYRGDPAFEKFIKGVVAKELAEEHKKQGKVDQNKTTPKAKNKGGSINFIKSPSDTTIYALALNRICGENLSNDVVNGILIRGQEQASPKSLSNLAYIPRVDDTNSQGLQNVSAESQTNKITNFIEGIRSTVNTVGGVDHRVVLQQPRTQQQPHYEPYNQGPRAGTSGAADRGDSNIEIAKEKANRLILDAERYKATVSALQGMSNCEVLPGMSNQEVLPDTPNQEVVDDDMFFHVTCHIDPMLKAKIAKGEFVELERLLPRQRGAGGNDNRMNIVQRDGQTYFVPASSPNRISSIRKWEQAFRIYAAVYSEANPSREAEIWQYVHVINVAASSYVWDNVSFYDVTFRQLMASNPGRPWSKIYNQMWNIAMREPLNRNGNGWQNNHQGYNRRQSYGNNHGILLYW